MVSRFKPLLATGPVKRLLCLDVEAALLASSLLQSLLLFHVVEAVQRRILLLLLHLNFGVNALLVSTLLN